MKFPFKHGSKVVDRTCKGCETVFEIDSDPIFDRFQLCEKCEETKDAQRAKEAYETERKAVWEDSVPETYRMTDRNHPDYPLSVHKLCHSWLAGAGIDKDGRRLFLGIVGDSGLCKTRVISQLVKRLIWDGKPVLWLNSSAFQWACQNQFNDSNAKEAGQWLRRYQRAGVLVFDDIGSLKSSETVSDNLYALLEHRTANSLPMLWTSNESVGEMLPGKNLTDKARKRNLSRLAGYSNILEI